MWKNQEIKLFIVLLISTAFIFSFSHYGTTAYNAFTSNMTGFSKGTMIGPVDVSGKSKEEATALLNESLVNWRSGTTITLQYKEKSVPIDINQFRFDIENSAAMAKDGQKNEIIVTFKSGDLYQYLQGISTKLDSSKVQLDPLLAELITTASNLSPGQYQVKVEKYVDASTNNEVISEASITSEMVPIDLGILVEKLNPIKIDVKLQFSFLKLLEERQLTAYSSDAASMIATVVYKTILTSNFAIVEKHTGQVMPDYVELGYEAKVDYQNHLDLVFVNPNEASYEIVLQTENNTVTALLKGSSFLYKYEVKLENELDKELEFNLKPKTIIQYAPLKGSAIRVKEKGSNGQLIKVYREVYGENDEWLRNEFISEDFYPPIHRIEIHPLTSSAENSNTNTQTETGQTGGNSQSDENNGSNSEENTSKQPSADEDDDDLFGKPNEELK